MSNEKELEELARGVSMRISNYYTEDKNIILAALKKAQAMEREKWAQYISHAPTCPCPNAKCDCGLTDKLK